MKKVKRAFIAIFLISLLSFRFSGTVLSLSCSDKDMEECKQKNGYDEKRNCWAEIQQACTGGLITKGKEKQSLENTIKQLNSQIANTQIQINQTSYEIEQLEKEIEELTNKIISLNFSLDNITQILIKRIAETYKQSRFHPLLFFFSSNGFSDFLNRYTYLKAAQSNDKRVLFELEEARANFDLQKQSKEEKQAEVLGLQTELEKQKSILATQQRGKQDLLQITKSDEVRYSELLKQAQREIESLANSEFVNKKQVQKGEVIGLMGNTGFSTGAHLHFGYFSNVSKDDIDDIYKWYFNKHGQPWDVLQSKSLYFEPQSCDDVSEGQNRTIGGGNLPWPMENPRITQCYGHTPYSSVYPESFHRGLDMSDKNSISVRSVEEGEAHFYRGTSSFGNNVRILHPNGTMTLYLHLQ